MQDDQRQERLLSACDGNQHLPPLSENELAIPATSNNDRISQLQTWLNLPTVREKRHYLEDHYDLLDRHSETILYNLFTQVSEQTQEMRNALFAFQDAHIRGGTAKAVQEAYINIYGVFALDLPPWLEVVEQRLTDLHNTKRPNETAETRVALLQDALEHFQDTGIFASEIQATLRRELADAWLRHPRTNRIQALETAISLCKEVLHIYSANRYIYQYAYTQNHLGNVYRERIAGEQRENLERAIACYQETLQVFTLEIDPDYYAKVQNNLGLVYWQRIAGERRENLEQAISCFQEALRVHTLESYPSYYAQDQNNLGNVYRERIAGERRENLERAIACYHETLRVRTFEAFPFDYALTQSNLGNAYGDRIAGERQENLERAIACYYEALRVRTFEALPFHYALTQINLGFSYWRRIIGQRWENLEQAIACYHEALRVYTLEAFPFHYALVQINLGLVYQDRIKGERQENLERAITYQHEALRVYTLEAFPQYYAEAQAALGNVYTQRIIGDREENLKQAVVYYREALRVYTIEASPSEARGVLLKLAEIEAERGRWNTVHDIYQKALEAEDLLVVLGAGTIGRDAILREGRDAAIRNGYALYRLGRIKEAIVAMERGVHKGLLRRWH